MQNGPLSFTGTAKLALGASHQIVDIQGSTIETGTASANPGTFQSFMADEMYPSSPARGSAD